MLIDNTKYDNVGAFFVRDIPEPYSLSIFALGLLGLASRRCKEILMWQY
ncbi:PEP-CTERM sorting domain-containing protein [Aliiglaciecola sp. LCG003]